MIIPSIDLLGGRAVQLRQGDEKALEAPEDPIDLARRFSFHGEVAVVDLDAALGHGDNRALVRDLCRAVPCRVGGGIRREEDVVDLIAAGAARVMVGTAAEPAFLRRLPPEWLIVALDARRGVTVDEGWRRETGEDPAARARRLERFCSGFLFTQVEAEGMMQGVPLAPVRKILAASRLPLTVAGGVRGIDDVVALERLGADVQVGMALYTGALDLDAALVVRCAFGAGPLPTIAQEVDGRVLMLAWSTAESLREALRTRRGVYYSRSRRALWVKGETSGHRQALVRARYDCDADAILFTVRQEGPACHSGRPACFGDPPPFDLETLRRIVASRRGADPKGSYTSRLLADGELTRAKVIEEAGEVSAARERRHLVRELADLMYHAAVLMEQEGIDLREVEAVLRGRHR